MSHSDNGDRHGVTGHLLCPLFAKAFSLEITSRFCETIYFFEGYCIYIYIYNINDYDFTYYCQY